MDVCEDLVAEIFLRLPLKSLLRLRTVSKSLRVRIDSPGFIRIHTLRSPKKFLIKQRAHGKYIYTMHSEDQMSSYAGITPVDYLLPASCPTVGSCNGIVCLYDYVKDIIYLWNPSIRRKLTLHKLPSHITCPSPAEFKHGFGFDPIIDDYKIVRFSRKGGTFVFVYTMKTNTWREVASPYPPNQCAYFSQCLFNGGLHWYSGYHYFHYILRFDLSSEIFSKIELPRLRITNYLMMIFKGCLAVLFDDDYSRIWVRNTFAASWSYVAIEGEEHRDLRSAHGGILYSNDSEGIMVYNPETEARSRLAKLGDHDRKDYIMNMITCVESLELLDIGTSCDVITRKESSKRKRA